MFDSIAAMNSPELYKREKALHKVSEKKITKSYDTLRKIKNKCDPIIVRSNMMELYNK
jgi:hypothetical protein